MREQVEISSSSKLANFHEGQNQKRHHPH
jgi:hypothetical protein